MCILEEGEKSGESFHDSVQKFERDNRSTTNTEATQRTDGDGPLNLRICPPFLNAADLNSCSHSGNGKICALPEALDLAPKSVALTSSSSSSFIT